MDRFTLELGIRKGKNTMKPIRKMIRKVLFSKPNLFSIILAIIAISIV